MFGATVFVSQNIHLVCPLEPSPFGPKNLPTARPPDEMPAQWLFGFEIIYPLNLTFWFELFVKVVVKAYCKP